MNLNISLVPETRTFKDIPHDEVFDFKGEKLTKKVYDGYHFAVDRAGNVENIPIWQKFRKEEKTIGFIHLEDFSLFTKDDFVFVKIPPSDFNGMVSNCININRKIADYAHRYDEVWPVNPTFNTDEEIFYQ